MPQSSRSSCSLMAFFMCGVSISAHGAVEYSIVNLSDQGISSIAEAINNTGQVAGQFSLSPGGRGFFYSSGSPTEIGTFGGNLSAAYAINDNGVAVGGATDENDFSRAFTYSAGVLTDLSSLGSLVVATGINNSGEIAGTLGIPPHPFLYSGGVVSDLGTLGGSSGSANGINGLGHVVGQSHLMGDSAHHGFVYSGSAMMDIGTLGGTFSSARAINDSSQIVGWAQPLGDVGTRAFLYDGGIMMNLGTLGGNSSQAFDINNNGMIVGYSEVQPSQPQNAFIYAQGNMRDLNSLIPSGSGWELREARSINDAGEIVGWGEFEGENRAFLLVPIPESSTYGAVFSATLLGWVLCRRLAQRHRS